MISQIIFVLLLGVASYLAYKRFSFVRRNIFLGRSLAIDGAAADRWNTMFRVALGQGKMFSRPFAAVMHIFIYVGFVIINIELLEIVIDGIFGTHRVFSFLGSFYNFLIGSFEIFAVLVIVSCVAFLLRRNVLKLKRFWQKEMTSWPRTDANLILVTEIVLMFAFLTMNASDAILQSRGAEHFVQAGNFPVSTFLAATVM